MRKLLVLLLLALSALWLYASWYWYTCIIKWFCSTTQVVQMSDESDTVDVSNNVQEPVNQETIQVEPESAVIEEDTQEEEPKQEELEQEVNIETETTSEPVVVVEEKVCETLIVTPIRLWSQNDAGDVKDLEDFLNAFQWESLEVNWIYEQADFDAVKRFQVKYASEILTPWGIKNPTGYVYRTTTEKINEIYCAK